MGENHKISFFFFFFFFFLSYRKNFLGLANKFGSAMVNELSVFESLTFLCTHTYLMVLIFLHYKNTAVTHWNRLKEAIPTHIFKICFNTKMTKYMRRAAGEKGPSGHMRTAHPMRLRLPSQKHACIVLTPLNPTFIQ